MRRLRLAVTVTLLLTAGGAWACGSGRTGGPRGDPAALMAAAPDKTVAQGSMGIVAMARAATVEGRVDLATGRGEARLSGPGLAGRATGAFVALDYGAAYSGQGAATADAHLARSLPTELVGPGLQPGNPLAVLDLLRGASKVEPYGGAAVRGVATQRYSVEIDAARVPEAARLGAKLVVAEVWIDDLGRVRRVQMGNDLRDRTTTTDRAGLLPVTIIDLIVSEVGD